MQIEKTIKNILVVRNDRFGEFLLNIPALRALKETFVDAKIIVVLDPYTRELAEYIPFIDEIIEWARKRHSLSEKLRLIGTLKKSKIDIAIMFNPSKEFNIFSFLAGIPVRVGYDRKWGFLLTHKIEDAKHLGQRHEVEYNLELTGLIGARTKELRLSLNTGGDEVGSSLIRDCGLEDDDILVALHPWTSDPVKQWPTDKFSELARRLLREYGLRVIIVGAKEDSGRSGELFGSFDNSLIDLTGKTTLKQLAALLRKCRLLISGDSGPVHLACAVGIPVVAIFRSDIPGKNARRWGPWGQGNFVIEKNRLSDISVDEVFAKVKEIL